MNRRILASYVMVLVLLLAGVVVFVGLLLIAVRALFFEGWARLWN